MSKPLLIAAVTIAACLGLRGSAQVLAYARGALPATVAHALSQQPVGSGRTTFDETAAVVRVVTTGTANVFNGNVAAARQVALQSAYAQAMASGAGSAIGPLTLIRNVQAVTDVVASRGRGFVKSYEVIDDRLLAAQPPRYEIRLKADVARRVELPADGVEGLKLFLDVIGTPKLLILLPQRNVSDSPASASDEPDGVLRTAEAAMATSFAKYGYSVATSDDLASSALASPAQVSGARQGVTTDAIAVARAAGADLLLTGVLRSATQHVSPQGVDFVSATTDASAKALVVSNGYVIDVFHRSVTKANVSALGAVSMTLQAIGDDLAQTLAWKIPSILAARPRVMHVVVSNITVNAAERLKAKLEKIDGVEVVRITAMPTATTRSADFEVLSGYVVMPQDEFLNQCIETAGPMKVIAADKYTLAIALI